MLGRASENRAISDPQSHWETIYREREPGELSWYQQVPEISLTMIAEADLPADAAILDIGGGTSTLAAHLIEAGYSDVTVADISPAALRVARAQLGPSADRVDWIPADVRSHDFGRSFDLWHDRAVLHFMVDPADRDAYLRTMRTALRPGGHLILATFGPQGPTTCSGLPVHRHSADELSRTVGTDFALIDSQLEQHHTPSGRTQEFVFAHLCRIPQRHARQSGRDRSSRSRPAETPPA